jgi:hypothetical protein
MRTTSTRIPAHESCMQISSRKGMLSQDLPSINLAREARMYKITQMVRRAVH